MEPKAVTEERVRETAYTLQGQSHDNFTISDRVLKPGSLNRHNIFERAPYLNTHVVQTGLRYELSRQMTDHANPDLEKVTRLWMPWAINARVWVAVNSWGEKQTEKGIQLRRPSDWQHRASKSLAWIFRHAGRHERDGGVPAPLVHASFCKARGYKCSMRTMMEVLAGDQYRDKDGKAQIRWAYCYDANLDAQAVWG